MQITYLPALPTPVTIDRLVNRIICGNSIDVLRCFPYGSVDLVVTSPPYDDLRDYQNEVIWNFEIFKQVASLLLWVLKPGGVIVWVVGDKVNSGSKSLTSFKQALFFQELGFSVYDVMIYEKTGTNPPHQRRYFNAFEYMFILSKGLPKTVNVLRDKPNKWAGHETYGVVTRREKDGSLSPKGKKVVATYGVRTNIWKYANGKGFTTRDKIAYSHPAIYPEKLAEDHILSWSNENDIVLDPFGGSGTTIKAAHILKRNWIYIDKVEDYCSIAKSRMESIGFSE